MNILITGARGQLGQDCTRVLGANHRVHACGSADLDITSPEQVRSSFRQVQPDLVVNCAAYTAVDRCETDQENCRRVNAAGPEIIATACADAGVKLIHISTDYVFDGAKTVPVPYTEYDQPGPASEYGRSKLAGEELIRAILQNHIILRTAWLYGIGGHNFLKTMLRLAVTNPRRTIRVVNDQYGSLTWSHRLARQIETLITGDTTGTFHATAEGHCTWYEGAKFFLEAMQVLFTLEPCTTADYPTPARRPVNSILENNRLKEHGLNRMVPWQEDVQEFVSHFRNELLAEARAKA